MNPRLDVYRPAQLRLPPLVHRADLGAADWHALLRDGVLRPLWETTAVPTDLHETPALRAAALAPLVPARSVVGRLAAAWVHAGGPVPDRVDVLVPPGTRRTARHPRVRTAQADLQASEVVQVGALQVTAVQRTGLDVARWVPAPQALVALRRLRPLGFDPAAARETLDLLPGWRGVRAGRAVLRALQEDGTSAGHVDGAGRAQARIAGSPAARDPVMR